MAISYDKIPNNVDLNSNRKLQKALEAWQPSFLEWWQDMGPEGFQQDDIYLRTAISVESSGWAHYDYVKMPDYRWGIFLTPPQKDRKIGFGDNAEMDVWNQVPGEFRKELRRIIVTQCDTEPASVEQQRLLGKCAPSLYDMRNLFQVNVEEGRHLWAMVHLLHEFFGRDGREEAEEMLFRRSGNPDSPRILDAFNKPIEDWLAFFCFTMFTDRDGKYQLGALAESGFDPLARATKFMLTEEAHHLFVGEITHASAVTDVEGVADLIGGGVADAVDVGEGDLHPLLARDVDASDTCHGVPLIPLSLPLLVPWVAADDADASVAPDHAALVTHRLDAGSDFHGTALLGRVGLRGDETLQNARCTATRACMVAAMGSGTGETVPKERHEIGARSTCTDTTADEE